MDKGMEEPSAYPGPQAPYPAAGYGACATVYPPTAAPATQVVQATTAVSTAFDQMKLNRTMTNFKVTFILMIILLVFGVTMLVANAYTDGKGVKTYVNYQPGKVWSSETAIRRDWHQGIWSGVLHIAAAVFFIILYAQAKSANFNLDQGSLRGTAYFFCVCLGLLTGIALVAMVMSTLTADFLQDKDNYDSRLSDCVTGYDRGGDFCSCSSDEDYVTKATCSEAAGIYHGLFTTIAILNAISIILTITAGIFACVGSCPGCCGHYVYTTPGMVVASPGQGYQAVPQVGIAYPAQTQVITTH